MPPPPICSTPSGPPPPAEPRCRFCLQNSHQAYACCSDLSPALYLGFRPVRSVAAYCPLGETLGNRGTSNARTPTKPPLAGQIGTKSDAKTGYTQRSINMNIHTPFGPGGATNESKKRVAFSPLARKHSSCADAPLWLGRKHGPTRTRIYYSVARKNVNRLATGTPYSCHHRRHSDRRVTDFRAGPQRLRRHFESSHCAIRRSKG